MAAAPNQGTRCSLGSACGNPCASHPRASKERVPAEGSAHGRVAAREGLASDPRTLWGMPASGVSRRDPIGTRHSADPPFRPAGLWGLRIMPLSLRGMYLKLPDTVCLSSWFIGPLLKRFAYNFAVFVAAVRSRHGGHCLMLQFGPLFAAQVKKCPTFRRLRTLAGR